MATKDWITKNIPELNPAQVTMLEHYIAEREREALAIPSWGEHNLHQRIKAKQKLLSEPTPVTQQTIKEREA